MSMRTPLTALALCLALPAQAELRDEPRVTEGLIAVGIAYEISEVCPQIGPRRLRGLNYLFSLKGIARDLGYSEAQIDAFVDSKSEQDRLEAIARTRLQQLGAQPGDAASHCAVGRAEMARDSAIGRLLR